MWGGSGGTGLSTQYIYRMNDSCDGDSFVEGVYIDASRDTDNPYFSAHPTGKTDAYGAEILDYIPIPEVEADAMFSKYEELVLDWEPLDRGFG